MFKTIIVDDQPFCIEILQDIIEINVPEIEIVAVCHSGKEGIKQILKHEPDLVILDVEMPEMNGFEMLKQVKDCHFELIFTTSFDKYSIQAIRHSALDFLLKPVVTKELKDAIERLERNHTKNITKKFNALFQRLNETKKVTDQIAVPTSDGLLFILTTEIIHCESDSNYTTLYLISKEKVVITKTLKDVESILEGNTFFRIHHSHLINVKHIKKYLRGNPGHVVLKNGTTVPIARNRKGKFLEQFVHF